jgi:hypothetical protein
MDWRHFGRGKLVSKEQPKDILLFFPFTLLDAGMLITPMGSAFIYEILLRDAPVILKYSSA